MKQYIFLATICLSSNILLAPKIKFKDTKKDTIYQDFFCPFYDSCNFSTPDLRGFNKHIETYIYPLRCITCEKHVKNEIHWSSNKDNRCLNSDIEENFENKKLLKEFKKFAKKNEPFKLNPEEIKQLNLKRPINDNIRPAIIEIIKKNMGLEYNKNYLTQKIDESNNEIRKKTIKEIDDLFEKLLQELIHEN